MSLTTNAPPVLTADQLTVIVASVSCLVFFVVILMLLLILYRKDPLCCRLLNRSPEHFTEALPQFHNSRQSLVGHPYDEQRASMTQSTLGHETPRRLFVIGKPSNYHLDGPLPRLPSYDSVRKKDRQLQIHSMIAQRFGLHASSHAGSEPPPTYEETIRQSLEISAADLQSLGTQVSVHVHGLTLPNLDQSAFPTSRGTDYQGAASSHDQLHSTSEEPLPVWGSTSLGLMSQGI